MAYILKELTIRTDNTATGIQKIDEIWKAVMEGTLPLLFDSDHHFQQGISPVSRYSHYSSDETGSYDLTIMGVNTEFFESMEQKADEGMYKKYDVSSGEGDLGACTKEAWDLVWSAQKTGEIQRMFTEDYESTVPAQYTKDGKAHCYLYISVR